MVMSGFARMRNHQGRLVELRINIDEYCLVALLEMFREGLALDGRRYRHVQGNGAT